MKASRIFKGLIVCLGMAVASAAATFLGFSIAKPFVFIFVVAGASLLLIGLVLHVTGELENDVTGQERDK